MNEIIKIKNIEGDLRVSSRLVAEHFEKQHKHVLEKIESIKVENSAVTKMFTESTYIAGTGKPYKEYLINRDGFALLAMGFTGKKALDWKLRYIEAFNKMEQVIKENKPSCIEDVLISSLQEMKAIKQQLSQATHHALSAKAEVKEIREIVKLDTTSWRRDTRKLIDKIAIKQGGFECINQLRKESYDLLEKRLGVNLERRLTNRRRVMAEEGISKSKRDKLNYLDVIETDKKLIEGYVAIVKEMAIKYGI